MKAISQILDEAADLVERPHGWCQGEYRVGDTYCALGAVRCAASAEYAPTLPIGIYAYLVAAVGHSSLSDWNDTPGRTQSEVVSKLREAAQLAREEGK